MQHRPCIVPACAHHALRPACFQTLHGLRLGHERFVFSLTHPKVKVTAQYGMTGMRLGLIGRAILRKLRLGISV